MEVFRPSVRWWVSSGQVTYSRNYFSVSWILLWTQITFNFGKVNELALEGGIGSDEVQSPENILNGVHCLLWRVKNSYNLIDRLKTRTAPSGSIHILFDVTNLYTCAPNNPTITRITDILQKSRIIGFSKWVIIQNIVKFLKICLLRITIFLWICTWLTTVYLKLFSFDGKMYLELHRN